MAVTDALTTETAYTLNPRRIAALRIDPQILVDCCKHSDDPYKLKVTKNALPADTKFVGGAYDVFSGTYKLAVWSASFDEVDPSMEPPLLLPPEITMVRGK